MIDGLDTHALIDIAVILVSVFSAYENNKVKVEILKLKLWISENFERAKRVTNPDTPH